MANFPTDDVLGVDKRASGSTAMRLLISEIYNGLHMGQGRFADASDGEITEAINDQMSEIFGNDWNTRETEGRKDQ